MNNHFKIKSKLKLHDLPIGAELPESDFACISGDYFVQLEYVEEKYKSEPLIVEPGIWSIKKSMMGLSLMPTQFSDDHILETFVHTKKITTLVNKFFSRVHIYKEFGIEIPRRCMLLYGPAGSGKSQAVTKVAKEYGASKDTAIIIWKTDVIDPHEVKEFVKRFEYKDVTKLIVIAEDIGGVEIDQVRIKSESSLLSLLDNQEKAFSIPVMIIATTNYPENLLANLTNRPQRIDDKIEVGYPSGSDRKKLFRFFAGKRKLKKHLYEMIASKPFDTFTPAHVKEIFVRSAIYGISLRKSMTQIRDEITKFNNLFQDKLKLGIGIVNDDY